MVGWSGDVRRRCHAEDPSPGTGLAPFAAPLENLRKLQAGIETLVTWAEERAAGQSAN